MPFRNLMAILIFISLLILCIFYVLKSREIKLKHGDKEISLGKSIDKKLEDYRKIEIKDRNLQMEMYRHSIKLDHKCLSDMRRVVREIDDDIENIFATLVTCDVISVGLCTIIQNELLQRIDENNLREVLSISYISGYLKDIMVRIKTKYSLYCTRRNLCNIEIPYWEGIEPNINKVISEWAENTKNILIKNIEDKIIFYEKFKNSFVLEEYKESAVIYPIKKNKQYLEGLRGE